VSLSAQLLTAIEITATIAGVVYVVLAARRNRLCWIAGAIGSALFGVLAALRGLPMQAGLQVYYVGMSVYGWVTWTRQSRDGDLPVTTWTWQGHLIAGVVLVEISVLTARGLSTFTEAAWPLLDSLTTWFSLFATWLVARARLENWIYWIIIDGVLVFLCYMQDMPLMALLYGFYVFIAAAGLAGWRRRMHATGVPA
jgi:nicotinamide mononucleotide transporter